MTSFTAVLLTPACKKRRLLAPCGRDAARRPRAGLPDRRRRRERSLRPRLREDAPRPRERLAPVPRGRAAARGGGRADTDIAPALGEADVHGRSGSLAHGGAR